MAWPWPGLGLTPKLAEALAWPGPGNHGPSPTLLRVWRPDFGPSLALYELALALPLALALACAKINLDGDARP